MENKFIDDSTMDTVISSRKRKESISLAYHTNEKTILIEQQAEKLVHERRSSNLVIVDAFHYQLLITFVFKEKYTTRLLVYI